MELGHQENQSFSQVKPEKQGLLIVRLRWQCHKKKMKLGVVGSTDSPGAVNSAIEMDESWEQEKALWQTEHPALCKKIPEWKAGYNTTLVIQITQHQQLCI